MPAVTVQTFHCASYQETDMAQAFCTTAALGHESGMFLQCLTANVSVSVSVSCVHTLTITRSLGAVVKK